MTFLTLTLLNPGCQRATGNWKSYRNYRKAMEKLSGDLVPVYTFAVTSNSNGTTIQRHDGLPSVKDSKRRRQWRFSAFFSFNSSSASKCTRALVLMLRSALSARRGRTVLFHAAKTFATQTNANRKNTMKFFFSRSIENFSIAWSLFRSLLTVKSSNAILSKRRCSSTTYVRLYASDDLKYRGRNVKA